MIGPRRKAFFEPVPRSAQDVRAFVRDACRAWKVPADDPVLMVDELASNAIRQAADELKLASEYQAHVRLTGPVPMADEQFATIKENAALNATLTIAVVLFILWLALRWWRIIFAVFVSLAVGLSVTAALGLPFGLTELHGGTVAAISRGEGHGATFVVKLPVFCIGHFLQTHIRLLREECDGRPGAVG